jgi:hypothetical protein
MDGMELAHTSRSSSPILEAETSVEGSEPGKALLWIPGIAVPGHRC